jgi:hypothetical protein
MIRLVDEFGPVLAGRGRATQMRKEIEALAGRGDEIIVDLEGVEAISPSFADELFGKLPVAIGERISFEGASPILDEIARMARTGRAQ